MSDEHAIETALTEKIRADGYTDGIIIGWCAVVEVLEGTTGDLNLVTLYPPTSAAWRLDGMLRNAGLPEEEEADE